MESDSTAWAWLDDADAELAVAESEMAEVLEREWPAMLAELQAAEVLADTPESD